MSNFQDIIEFIRENYSSNENDTIPLHSPKFYGNEKMYLEECIETTFVSSVGKFVDRFERLCTEYTGAKYAVATVNGTAALHISLLLAGVDSLCEVITQPLTFVATTNAISYTGASPLFLDVDRTTMGLSSESLADFLNNETRFENGRCVNKKTGKIIKACIPMHTFGFPCKIDEVTDICRRFNIVVVEDAAESLGSFYGGQHTGTFGLMGTLSFNGNKTITCGGGGMILTNSKELAEFAKHITTTAKVPHNWEYNHDMVAYNYRLTNLSAALGCAQMENLEDIILSKRQLADQYDRFFATTDITFFKEPENCRANYWLNTLLMKDRAERDSFLDFTNSRGIQTRPAWKLMNTLEMFNNFQCGDLSNAKWFEERIVNIPSSAT